MGGVSGIGSVGSLGNFGSLGSSPVTNLSSATVAPTPSTVVSLDNSLPNKQVGVNLYSDIQNSDSLNINLVSKETGLPMLFINNFIKTNLSEDESRKLTESALIILLLELLKTQQLNTIMNMY